jgi:tetratricopeptide (TPR) repeat protein
VPAPRLADRQPPISSVADLHQRVRAMGMRLTAQPDDGAAAVDLTASLLRLARVTGDPTFAIRAESTVRRLLARDPESLTARRHLAAALIAQHRFAEAIAEAERCLAAQPRDSWSRGIIADAAVELGDYTRAIDVVAAMLDDRPDAAAYARASYVRQLQGDVDGAVTLLRMSAEATSPADVDTLAWTYVRLGSLFLEQNRLADARREIERARFLLSGYSDASRALIRVLLAEGRLVEARAELDALLRGMVLPGDHALAADLLTRLGQRDEAQRHAMLAEAGWRSDVPDPVQLAHFLVQRGRAADAAAIAAQAAATRHDIFILDALAWAYFKQGRAEQAAALYVRVKDTGLLPLPMQARARAVAMAVENVRGEAR